MRGCSAWMAALWMGLSLAGCSSGPMTLARNEINEPVFHETLYASLGASAGPVASHPRENGGYRPDFYFTPGFLYDYDIGPWASFTLLPVLWNFLLTGSQFSGPDLKSGKPLIALHAGVSGFSYSQRDGFLLPGLAALSGKYRFDDTWFADLDGSFQSRDVRSTANSVSAFSIALGDQISGKNSVRLGYSLEYFHCEPGLAYPDHGLEFADGNARTKILLSHSFYASPHQVLGPEFTFAFKDSDFRNGHYLALGLHYDYRF